MDIRFIRSWEALAVWLKKDVYACVIGLYKPSSIYKLVTVDGVVHENTVSTRMLYSSNTETQVKIAHHPIHGACITS